MTNNTTPKQSKTLINKSAVRSLAKQYGRRCSKEFLDQLNNFVSRKLVDVCTTHNGSKKTLDAVVASFNGIS